jgi:CspA family cold shock protein
MGQPSEGQGTRASEFTSTMSAVRGRVRVVLEAPVTASAAAWREHLTTITWPDLEHYLTRLREQKEPGVVKWFDEQKGYGFLHTVTGELFVHWRGLLGDGFRTLAQGDRVRFFRAQGVKGETAVEVELMGESRLPPDQ